jgi:hypothetical protein
MMNLQILPVLRLILKKELEKISLSTKIEKLRKKMKYYLYYSRMNLDEEMWAVFRHILILLNAISELEF